VLTLNIEQLKNRLQALTSELSDDINPGFEVPPHY